MESDQRLTNDLVEEEEPNCRQSSDEQNEANSESEAEDSSSEERSNHSNSPNFQEALVPNSNDNLDESSEGNQEEFAEGNSSEDQDGNSDVDAIEPSFNADSNLPSSENTNEVVEPGSEDENGYLEEQLLVKEDPLDEKPPLSLKISVRTQETDQISPNSVPNPAEKGKGPYFCDLCRKTFTNYGSYRRHLRMHYCDKKYTCHLCGRQFFRRYLWVKHQEKIHGNDPSSCRCPHCGDWSSSPDALREHLKTQHKRTNGCKENWTKDFNWPQGGSKSPVVSPTPLSPSTKKKSRKIKPKENSSQPMEQNYENETDLVTNIKQEYPCQDCEENFTTEDDLDDHRVKEHAANTSRYGRIRKQRVLFNCDTYISNQTRKFKKGSSPNEESQEEYNYSLEEISHVKNEATSEANPTVKPIKITIQTRNPLEPEKLILKIPTPPCRSVKTEYLIKADEKEDKPRIDSMLSKLLQQPLPTTLPKNVSHRGNFFCDKCRRFFINRSSFLRHKKMHTGVRPFSCEFCCASFFRSESLTTHMKKHASETEFRCYQCGFKAANSASLRNHFYQDCSKNKSASGDPWSPVNPEETNEYTSQKEKLPDLKNGSRNIAGYCSLCNRAFFNLSNYQRHAKLHSSMASAVPMETTFSCSVCNKVFSNRAKFAEHILSHSQDNPSNETVSGMPTSLELLKRFGNFSAQEEEIPAEVIAIPNEDDGVEQPEAKLPETEDRPPSVGSGESESSQRVFCCRLCPLAFTDQKTYFKHLKTHKRSESPVSYYCRYCGRPHKSKAEVNRHEHDCYLNSRSENKLQDCYNCGVHFDTSSALREHVKAAHLNDRMDLGKKKYNQQEVAQAISEEISETLTPTDSDAGRYKCGKCSGTFSDLQLIFAHFQSAHGVGNSNDNLETSQEFQIGSKPSISIMKQLLSSPPVSTTQYLPSTPANPKRHKAHTCQLCLKSFSDALVAKEHEKQAHVMVDWYRCAICDKTGSKKLLLRHMETHMLKVGSVVTTVEDQDKDSESDNSSPPIALKETRQSYCKKPKNSETENNPIKRSKEEVSVFCQLCQITMTGVQVLERHRHTTCDPTISHPYLCYGPGCGKSFALKVEAIAHLQTKHSKVLNDVPTNKMRWSLGENWKELVAGKVGPFSQSLVQLSMAAAENGPEIVQTEGTVDSKKFHKNQSDVLENLASSGELTITKVNDVEMITVEPLVDVFRQMSGDSGDLTERRNQLDDGLNLPQSAYSPNLQTQGDYEEGALQIDEGVKISKKTKPEKVLLKCDDCQSVFTNPCSWKRHRKLHLGQYRHTCPHCQRKFYRKDHCDKHVKTHLAGNTPRKKNSLSQMSRKVTS